MHEWKILNMFLLSIHTILECIDKWDMAIRIFRIRSVDKFTYRNKGFDSC